MTLLMEQPEDITVLPGMAGRAAGTLVAPDNAAETELVIPVTSVFSPEIEGPSYVWVIDEASNTVARREVEISMLASSGLVVGSGLERGEMITTAGVHFLVEGQEVQPEIQ